MSAAEHKGRVDHLHTGRLGVGFLTHMCDRKSSEDTCFIPRGETRFSSNSWNFCSEIEGGRVRGVQRDKLPRRASLDTVAAGTGTAWMCIFSSGCVLHQEMSRFPTRRVPETQSQCLR